MTNDIGVQPRPGRSCPTFVLGTLAAALSTAVCLWTAPYMESAVPVLCRWQSNLAHTEAVLASIAHSVQFLGLSTAILLVFEACVCGRVGKFSKGKALLLAGGVWAATFFQPFMVGLFFQLARSFSWFSDLS